MALDDPLVSVITPVYNGAAFLQECIDSVLAQTYGSFEYIIADNCSSDESLGIAEKAASIDDRIRVVQSDQHVGPIQNWNRSLQFVDPASDYIKFVHADDWIFPDCLTRMVDVAQSNDKVGLISAYRLEEDRVSLDRLPPDAPLVPGTDWFTMDGQLVLRAVFLHKASVLGSPTSVLFRADLVPEDGRFYSEDYLHADKDACLRVLRDNDFGFITQVLTFTRRHNESVTSLTNSLDTRRQENLLLLKKFGPVLLPESEFQHTLDWELRAYYDFLAKRVGTRSGDEFWNSHREVLEASGNPFSTSQLMQALLRRWKNPATAMTELIHARSRNKCKVEKETMRFLAASRAQAQEADK